MLCNTAKKVNSSLKKLPRVGGAPKNAKLDMSNPLDILSSLVPDKGDIVRELIHNKFNDLLYVYYNYVDNFKIRPLSWEELLDGTSYLSLSQEIKAVYRGE